MNQIKNKRMFSLLTDAIMLLDGSTQTIKYLNPSCAQLLGYDAVNTAEIRVQDVFVHDDAWAQLEAISGGQMIEIDKTLLKGHKEIIPCIIKAWKEAEDAQTVYCIVHRSNELITLEQFRAVMSSYPEPTLIVRWNDTLDVEFANEAFYAMFGGEQAQFETIFCKQFVQTMVCENRGCCLESIQEQLRTQSGFCLDIQVTDVTEHTHFLSFSGTKIPCMPNQPQMLYCRLHNTDEKHSLITALESEKHFFQAVQSLASDLLFRYYIQEGSIQYYGVFRETLGLAQTYVDYPACVFKEKILFEQDYESFVEMLQQMSAGQNGSGYYRAYDQTGKTVWLKKEWCVLCDENKQPLEVIGRVSNIQVQKELEERINVDALTGCLQKRAFEALVSKDIEMASNHEHTVIIVDLDNFKAVNDNLGHQFGDMVLTEVGEKLRNLFRVGDYVGRIGGDEFMIFMRDTASATVIAEKATAILHAMDRTYQGALHRYRVSASIGIATYPQNGKTFQELYDCADIAMFDAKNRGKNDFVCYHKDLSKGTMENTLPYDVAARALAQHFDSKVVSQSFNLLFETKDFNFSMQEVLRVMGTRFGVSRVYVFECSKSNPDCYDNTYEWCEEGIAPAIAVCQNISQRNLSNFDETWQRRGHYLLQRCHDARGRGKRAARHPRY